MRSKRNPKHEEALPDSTFSLSAPGGRGGVGSPRSLSRACLPCPLYYKLLPFQKEVLVHLCCGLQGGVYLSPTGPLHLISLFVPSEGNRRIPPPPPHFPFPTSLVQEDRIFSSCLFISTTFLPPSVLFPSAPPSPEADGEKQR